MHSDNGKVYLRPNVMVEPLVDQWYAWSHLLSPATAAMNIAHRHLKIMESYVQAPEAHAAAAMNPRMLGGPFVDYRGERVQEIQELIDWTRRERAHMLELANAIQELDDLLQAEADGFSLHPLYPKIPDLLRGYVELVYDLDSQPSFRLIESLLYRSRYYNPSSQSLMLSIIDQDDRPFILSTPRLVDGGDLHLPLPFHHPGLDELFAMKSTPRPLGAISERLGVDAEQAERFSSFFTPEAPPPYQPYAGEGLRWRYFGHACILVESRRASVLLDPVLSYTYENDISRYTYQDLPERIDYVLITHNHQDHILFETILQIRHKVGHVVVPRNGGGALQDPSLKLLLHNVGFDRVIEIDELDTIEFEDGTITGLPFFGEHADLDIRTKMAYLVQLGGHSLTFMSDSCNVEPRLYDHLHDLVGDVEVLFLGMECDGAPLSWVYGPLLTRPLERRKDHSRRLSGSNFEQGWEIVRRFNFKEVYVYAMGQEPWLNYVMSKKYAPDSNPIVASNRLLEGCQERGIVAERLFGEKEILLP